eukprot:6171606-Pleurochrysis_carterae.AAC.1
MASLRGPGALGGPVRVRRFHPGTQTIACAAAALVPLRPAPVRASACTRARAVLPLWAKVCACACVRAC